MNELTLQKKNTAIPLDYNGEIVCVVERYAVEVQTRLKMLFNSHPHRQSRTRVKIITEEQ